MTMSRPRAAEVLRWGVYADPPASPIERRDAVRMLDVDPSLAEAVFWTHPMPTGPARSGKPPATVDDVPSFAADYEQGELL